jgi:DNA-binding response OmpR family regulator
LLTILAIGEDVDLLGTRANVLRKTGANVLCSSGAAALKYIAEWEFDLVVLCHSMRQRDVERITEAAHHQGSKTLVLLMVSDRMREPEFAGVDLDARSFVEPDCLIRSAIELLGRHNGHPPSRIMEEKLNVTTFSSFSRKKPANYPAEMRARKALVAILENRRTG